MSDITTSGFVRQDLVPERAAPVKTTGFIGLLRTRLFNSPTNILLTIVSALLLWFILVPALRFLLVDAVWTGSDRNACLAENAGHPVGACWPFVQAKFSRNLPEVLLMNITVKPFDDLKVRQAIAYAVDRQQLIDLAYPGAAKPWYSPVPEGFFGATTDVPHFEHDVARAKQLLSEAGYPNGLDVTLNVYDTQKLASDVLSEQLKQVGIRVNEEVLDQPTFIGRVIQNQGINFSMHCCVRQPDADIILSDMFSPKYRGAIYISHADLEAELSAARKELDPTRRQQMYVDLQKKIVNDVDMIPVAMVNDRSVNVSALKGMPSVEAIWGLDLTRLSAPTPRPSGHAASPINSTNCLPGDIAPDRMSFGHAARCAGAGHVAALFSHNHQTGSVAPWGHLTR